MFSKFARVLSNCLGSSVAFVSALLLVVLWSITGPFFEYSENWQLVINTSTTIITFLMVFLLQNTQNHDTIAIQLKLDEIIRGLKGAHNELLKVEELPDEKLKEVLELYENLASQVKNKIKAGESDVDTPEIEKNIEDSL